MGDETPLYKAALEAVNELFSDTSVSQVTTWGWLDELMGEIEIMMDSLDKEAPNVQE